jgi:NADP-dependent 3-hydroxy acid dehydrogenase YdfG
LTLAGRVAVVTGAGRGIGRAVALGLSREGAAAVLASRTRSELESVATAIAGGGGRPRVVPTDVTVDGAVEALMAEALGAFGRIDILVPAAGAAAYGAVAEAKAEDWDAMVAVNLRAVMRTCRAALPTMVAQRSGTIILIGSIAARRPIPGAAAYSATKAGVEAFGRALAEELRRTGVRVGVLAAGAVDTPIWDRVPDPPDRERMLKAEDVARAAVLMAALPARASLEDLTLLPAGGIL